VGAGTPKEVIRLKWSDIGGSFVALVPADAEVNCVFMQGSLGFRRTWKISLVAPTSGK